MASGLVPVSTDVGDARRIIANTGKIIPIRDDNKMYKAIKDIINYNDKDLSNKKNDARSRIIENYSKAKMVVNYNNIYKSVLIGLGK